MSTTKKKRGLTSDEIEEREHLLMLAGIRDVFFTHEQSERLNKLSKKMFKRITPASSE